MKEKVSLSLIITIALLIVGNLIGAGILALPIQTGLAGFLPSILGMMVIGSAMFFTAIVLSNEAVIRKQVTFNYPSLYHDYLGPVGKWIAIAANMIILYGLLTAYLSGASSIIMNLFHIKCPQVLVMLIFFAVLTGITVAGMGIVEKYNALLTILMFVSFGAIAFMGEQHIVMQNYKHRDWMFLINIAPIAVTAFHFHNIIPAICQSLKWDLRAIFKATLIGMIIGYIMNFIWVQVGIGVLGESNILNAFEQNLPATVPMAKVITSPLFVIGSLLFSLLAIATSYLANGIGLMGFVEDLMENHLKKSGKLLKLIIAFGPPLVIAIIYPDIFIKAIDVAGGVGIVILFGILPSIIAMIRFRSPKIRLLSAVMLIMFVAFLIFELGQEFGLLRISPSAESWNTAVFAK